MKTSMFPHAAALAAATLLAACGGEPSKADASSTGAATSATSAAAPAPAKAGAPEAKATTVELKGAKGPQKVSVALPPGVVEIEDRQSSMKSFRKGKEDFDGYSLTLGEDRPERAKAGMEALLKQVEAQKEAKKTRLIDKATWEGGQAAPRLLQVDQARGRLIHDLVCFSREPRSGAYPQLP